MGREGNFEEVGRGLSLYAKKFSRGGPLAGRKERGARKVRPIGLSTRDPRLMLEDSAKTRCRPAAATITGWARPMMCDQSSCPAEHLLLSIKAVLGRTSCRTWWSSASSIENYTSDLLSCDIPRLRVASSYSSHYTHSELYATVPKPVLAMSWSPLFPLARFSNIVSSQKLVRANGNSLSILVRAS